MRFSLFETAMLICFGLSWPVSIHRTYKARNVEAKSPAFLILVIIGYAAGIAHKLLYDRDVVIFLYAVNGIMVATDLALVLTIGRRNPTLQSANAVNHRDLR